MSFRFVIFPDPSRRIATRGIEITQRCAAQSVDSVRPEQGPFQRPFALAIGRAGIDRGVLVDGDVLGSAEQRRGRRQDELSNAVAKAGLDQSYAIVDVFPQIAK